MRRRAHVQREAKVGMTVWFEASSYAAMVKQADETGTSMQELVRQAVRQAAVGWDKTKAGEVKS